mmetsp:Transcript_16535/g.45175  ORF Transcript_16535/g.45175 Transcript_16535/m.45175 type:complete len:285 (-) Transcript_16535:674-1528(-)
MNLQQRVVGVMVRAQPLTLDLCQDPKCLGEVAILRVDLHKRVVRCAVGADLMPQHFLEHGLGFSSVTRPRERADDRCVVLDSGVQTFAAHAVQNASSPNVVPALGVRLYERREAHLVRPQLPLREFPDDLFHTLHSALHGVRARHCRVARNVGVDAAPPHVVQEPLRLLDIAALGAHLDKRVVAHCIRPETLPPDVGEEAFGLVDVRAPREHIKHRVVDLDARCQLVPTRSFKDVLGPRRVALAAVRLDQSRVTRSAGLNTPQPHLRHDRFGGHDVPSGRMDIH